jgi:hypothetical protein
MRKRQSCDTSPSSAEDGPAAISARRAAAAHVAVRQTHLSIVTTRQAGSKADTARQTRTTAALTDSELDQPKRKRRGPKDKFTGRKYKMLTKAIPQLIEARTRQANKSDPGAVKMFYDNFLADWIEEFGLEDDPHQNNAAQRNKGDKDEDEDEDEKQDKEQDKEQDKKKKNCKRKGDGDESEDESTDSDDDVHEIDRHGNCVESRAERAKKISKLRDVR